MLAWMRVLEVHLTNTKSGKQFVFGNNWASHTDDYEIDVTIDKYMSSLKDQCLIRISNIPYSQIVQIVSQETYSVKVICGYRQANRQTVFDGGVLYISNDIEDFTSNTLIILCASNLVSKYGRTRINLTLNSGINMYSAIKFVCSRAGLNNVVVSEQMKTKFIQELMNVNDNVASWIDKIVADSNSYISNSDTAVSADLSVFNADKSNLRVITLNEDNINLSSGYPHLTSDGLSLTVIPTFAFMCGDTIKLDNSLINLAAGSQNEANRNYGFYIDKNGMYMIYQLSYHLQNRGSAFSVTMLCKTRSLISNYIGR